MYEVIRRTYTSYVSNEGSGSKREETGSAGKDFIAVTRLPEKDEGNVFKVYLNIFISLASCIV